MPLAGIRWRNVCAENLPTGAPLVARCLFYV